MQNAKKLAATPTPTFFKCPAKGTVELECKPCSRRDPRRYVLPMRTAPFVPGEETGACQFGSSGKGRFFTAGTFFERLEPQDSKRARQVRGQVNADWISRAKLTRRWTQILRKRRRVRMRTISRAQR